MPSLALAQSAKLLSDLAAFDGNIGYYATGNTMAQPDPAQADGLACVLRQNTAVVPAAQLSTRATLLKAYLYYSGNVYAYASASKPPDLARIDRSVSLQFPGRTTAEQFDADLVYSASFSDGLLGAARTSYFYTARADITARLKLNLPLAGTYIFSDFSTRICPDALDSNNPNNPDPICDDASASAPHCESPGYFAATASFFIVLVYSDPGLPPRSIKFFDGLEVFDKSTSPRTLSLTGVQVSVIPRGQLTFYGIEGDARQTGDSADIAAGGRAATPLGRIITPAPGAPTSNACGDSTWPNWSNNLFDSSTVLDPSNPSSGTCTRGIDIDTYDISNVLQANDTRVDVTLRTSTTDTFAIPFAAISVDVFRPVIGVDSRKQLVGRASTTAAPNDGPVVFRIGISNTGNIPALGVNITDLMPPGLSNLKILNMPPGASDNSDLVSGLVDVRNINVYPGEVAEVRYQVTIPCPVADGAMFFSAATMSASTNGAPGATLPGPTIHLRDPGGMICNGTGPTGATGPTLPSIFFERKLLGGAGCRAAGGGNAWALLFAGLFFFVRRQKLLPLLVAGIALVSAQYACRKITPPPVIPFAPEPTAPTGVPTPAAAPSEPAQPGTACPGADEMLKLDAGGCIDRYEVVIEEGTAKVKFGSVPASGVSFADAKAACVAAGKRLCSAAEWERACRGTRGSLYPYGDSAAPKKCNGFDAEWGELWQAGAGVECKSDLGVFDMSGNVSEWVDADYPFVKDGVSVQGKQLRGGSYIGNASGLSCTALVGADPAAVDPRAGFRCCR